MRDFIILVSVSLLLAGITTKPASAQEPTPTPVHQDITTKEYWIERGYELTGEAWSAGETLMVKLYKDHELIIINYEDQDVASCYGSYDSCYVDFIDEVKILHTWE